MSVITSLNIQQRGKSRPHRDDGLRLALQYDTKRTRNMRRDEKPG